VQFLSWSIISSVWWVVVAMAIIEFRTKQGSSSYIASCGNMDIAAAILLLA